MTFSMLFVINTLNASVIFFHIDFRSHLYYNFANMDQATAVSAFSFQVKKRKKKNQVTQHTKLSPEVERQIKSAYQNGQSFASIARKINLQHSLSLSRHNIRYICTVISGQVNIQSLIYILVNLCLFRTKEGLQF